MYEPVKIAFMNEKVEGHGEDAPPLLFSDSGRWAVSVFDGMGGAGSSICNSDYGEEHTKAYVASRVTEELILGYIKEKLAIHSININELHQKICSRLRFEMETFPPPTQSALRSRLIREYPTTIAMVTAVRKEEYYEIDSYWAGDSRCYLWTKEGLFQISKDDLIEDNDPMENLRNDSALSNCICADRDFVINHKQITLPLDTSFIIMAATDGCFGYFPTPMHFEQVIRDSLKKATNCDEWGRLIETEILKVAGDDTSMSLQGIGFESFSAFKKFGLNSLQSLNKKISKLEKEILSLEDSIENKKNSYRQLLEVEWNEYKKKLLKLIADEDNANA